MCCGNDDDGIDVLDEIPTFPLEPLSMLLLPLLRRRRRRRMGSIDSSIQFVICSKRDIDPLDHTFGVILASVGQLRNVLIAFG